MTSTQWNVTSIVPEPRMPHNINKEFTLTIVPGGKVTNVVSIRPAFAKVRSFNVESAGSDKIILKVRIHGMSAGTLNVPFEVNLEGGSVAFTIRTIG